jgi:2-keto-4-pentenoate hydratase/2-oxohepta-3-ene-1,7-dioic acid hydratase in catechol pathway
MRTANLSGRLVIITDRRAVDVEKASGGRFSADPQSIYSRWAEFRTWPIRPISPARTPQRWLAPGDELVGTIEGIGELRQRFVG